MADCIDTELQNYAIQRKMYKGRAECAYRFGAANEKR